MQCGVVWCVAEMPSSPPLLVPSLLVHDAVEEVRQFLLSNSDRTPYMSSIKAIEGRGQAKHAMKPAIDASQEALQAELAGEGAWVGEGRGCAVRKGIS